MLRPFAWTITSLCVVLTFWFSSTLTSGRRSFPPISRLAPLGRKLCPGNMERSRRFAVGNKEELAEVSDGNAKPTRRKVDKPSRSPTPSPLLVPELVAILVSSELLGLLDVINDPDFGGWLQPIPTSIPSLPTLLSRFSTCGIAWIWASNVRAESETIDDNGREMNSIVGDLPRTMLIFSAILFLVLIVVRVLQGVVFKSPDLFDGLFQSVLLDVVRNDYVIAMAIVAARYIFNLW